MTYVKLDSRDAAIISWIIQELGHPQGPFGEQHLLQAACQSVSDKTGTPIEMLTEALFIAVRKIDTFVVEGSADFLAQIKKNTN